MESQNVEYVLANFALPHLAINEKGVSKEKEKQTEEKAKVVTAVWGTTVG